MRTVLEYGSADVVALAIKDAESRGYNVVKGYAASPHLDHTVTVAVKESKVEVDETPKTVEVDDKPLEVVKHILKNFGCIVPEDTAKIVIDWTLSASKARCDIEYVCMDNPNEVEDSDFDAFALFDEFERHFRMPSHNGDVSLVVSELNFEIHQQIKIRKK